MLKPSQESPPPAAFLLLLLFTVFQSLPTASAGPDLRLPQHSPSRRHIGHHDHNHEQFNADATGATSDINNGLDADDPDFSGIVDFSEAEPGPGGSWCITKTKFVDHMVKDQIKECWHENITQCHDTYVTEFLPSQEQKCEETFWKSCKIDFRDMPYNYTMKQCNTPLVKVCDDAYGQPEIVCKTWFESECNTTYIETTPNVEDKPNTWCKKVPRKICAPDNCKMMPGPEECHNKVLVSTVQKPTEICDLQPQQHCRLITKLTPHLLSKEVCKNIPKEVCHLALTPPKQVKKPITLKWCTRKDQGINSALKNPALANYERVETNDIPTYQPRQSYLPPPPPPPPQSSPVVTPASVDYPRPQRAAGPLPLTSAAPKIVSTTLKYSTQDFSRPYPVFPSNTVTARPNFNFRSEQEAEVFSPKRFRPSKNGLGGQQQKNKFVEDNPVYDFHPSSVQDTFKPAASIRNAQRPQKKKKGGLPLAFQQEILKVLDKDEFNKVQARRSLLDRLSRNVEEHEEPEEKPVYDAKTVVYEQKPVSKRTEFVPVLPKEEFVIRQKPVLNSNDFIVVDKPVTEKTVAIEEEEEEEEEEVENETTTEAVEEEEEEDEEEDELESTTLSNTLLMDSGYLPASITEDFAHNNPRHFSEELLGRRKR